MYTARVATCVNTSCNPFGRQFLACSFSLLWAEFQMILIPAYAITTRERLCNNNNFLETNLFPIKVSPPLPTGTAYLCLPCSIMGVVLSPPH